jgi:hypothetical protein
MAEITSKPASVVTVVPSSSGLPAVRVFDVASINKHIDASLTALEPDKRVACVAYADGEGVKVALVGRIDASIPGELKWTVMATKPYAGSFEWNMGVKWSI